MAKQVCPNGNTTEMCTFRGNPHELKEHYLNCDYAVTRCKFCKLGQFAKDILAHELTCAEEEVECGDVESLYMLAYTPNEKVLTERPSIWRSLELPE